MIAVFNGFLSYRKITRSRINNLPLANQKGHSYVSSKNKKFNSALKTLINFEMYVPRPGRNNHRGLFTFLISRLDTPSRIKHKIKDCTLLC